jgi:ribosomal protein S21
VCITVIVKDGNLRRAIKVLRRELNRDNLFRELRLHGIPNKTTRKKAKAKAAYRRWLKAEAKKRRFQL